MTTLDPTSVRCTGCGASGEPGDRFCVHCRTPLTFSAPPPPPPAASRHDDGTTRYLCAAAYLDPVFADRAIAEFLVEPRRAIPPSPGLDASAVLRDAVAARTARKVLDAAVLVLLALFVFLAPTLFVLWLLTAVCVVAASGDLRKGGSVKALVVLGAIMAAVFVVPDLLGVPAYLNPVRLLTSGIAIGPSSLLAGGLVGAVILLVLTLWEQWIHDLTRTRFRSSFQPYAADLSAGWERTLRSQGHRRWSRELARFDAAVAEAERHGGADVIVYRTPSPFVGAGFRIAGDAITLPLVPEGSEDDGMGYPLDEAPGAQPPPFTASELLDGIDGAVRSLADSPSLSPSGRLSGVTVHEQVFVSAQRLLANPSAPAVRGILEAGAAPLSSVPRDRAHRLTDFPEEVARQYRCYRVEAWERDLTVSTFVNAATDGRMLHLEWQHCVLPPVQERFRSIDYADTDNPVARAFQAAVALPATALGRLGSLFSVLRPLPVQEGVVDPAAYGAGASLREIAAEPRVVEFFQRNDTDRYIELFQRAVVRGTRDFLDTHGYSIETLQKIHLNSLTINGGDQRGAVFGTGRTTQHNHAAPRKDS